MDAIDNHDPQTCFFCVIVAALDMLYPAGATSAAFACARLFPAADAPMDHECDDITLHQDCTLACAPTYAAIAPVPLETGTPELAVQISFWNKVASVSALLTGPEPPPPRIR